MKTNTFSLLASIALLSFASCTDEMQELANEQSPLLKQIVMTTQDFQPEADSRTIYQIADGAVNCTWAANDTVGVFPDEGAQAYFPMASGAGTKNASFDGKGWALKDGRTYGAYYPFVGAMYLDRNAVPVSYTGQTQTGNASMEHLGAYDYMVATPTAPEFGSAQFMFKHISALVQLKITIPEPATLTSVKLVADTELFTVKGKVDIMANTPSITAVTSAKNIKLDLQDVKTTEANQVVTLYMMLPPTDLSTHTLKAVVVSDKGNQEIALESKNFQAGKAYGLSGSPESGEIVGDGSYKDGVVSLEEAGTMKKLLGKDYLSITSLKVVGPINGDDVYYLRKMLGAEYFDQSERGKLTTLDLSDARIVKGGGWYYEYKYNSYSTQHYTTNDVIGERMFDQCTNLKEIAIPNGVSSIGEQAFTGCDALSSVYIKDLSAWCRITFSDLASNPLVHGAKLYLDNKEVTELVIPEDITEIKNYAFYGCKSIIKVVIPDHVTSIGNSAFTGCDALSSVYIKDLSAWCRITFSDYANPLYNGAKLYFDNKEVNELVIPEDITEIKDYAFYGCKSIVKVVIPNHVTSIGNSAFTGCDALTTVTIGDGVTSLGWSAFSSCKALTTVIIGDGVTSIENNAFTNCDALTSINIPDNVTSLGWSAFWGCDALTTVTIGDGVTSIQFNTFTSCDALTTVTIGDGVTSIDAGVFYYCSAMTDFYCHATTPPSINTSYNNSSFPKYGEKTTLHIPERCRSTYKSSGWGNYFINIVEMD